MSVLTAICCAVGYIPYILAILRKTNPLIPSKVTWIIWLSLDGIALAGMYQKDAVNSQLVVATMGALITAILSLKYGVIEWTIIDKFCLTGAITAIISLLILENPILGIGVSLAGIFIGSIPAAILAWKNPEHESKTAWVFFVFSCIFALCAIPKWTIEDAAQPIMFSIIVGTMACIIYLRLPQTENKKPGL